MSEHLLYSHTSDHGIFTLTRIVEGADAATGSIHYELKCDKDSERAITVHVDPESLYGLMMVLGSELVLPDPPA